MKRQLRKVLLRCRILWLGWQAEHQRVGFWRATGELVSELLGGIRYKALGLFVALSAGILVWTGHGIIGLWRVPKQSISEEIAFARLRIGWLTLFLGLLAGSWTIFQLQRLLQRPRLILLRRDMNGKLVLREPIQVVAPRTLVPQDLELFNASDILAEDLAVRVLPDERAHEMLIIRMSEGQGGLQWQCVNPNRQEWQTQDRAVLIHGGRSQFIGQLRIEMRKVLRVNGPHADVWIRIDYYHRIGRGTEWLYIRLGTALAA